MENRDNPLLKLYDAYDGVFFLFFFNRKFSQHTADEMKNVEHENKRIVEKLSKTCYMNAFKTTNLDKKKTLETETSDGGRFYVGERSTAKAI
jgi:hypothetical protein